MKNHTITVEQRTGRSLTACQKEGAKVALVKQLKKWFTGEFKQYNSPSVASDAASDPAFCAAVADFFAELPGYEQVWGQLRVGYQGELEKQQRIEQLSKGSLNIDEDVIRHLCSNFANSMIMTFRTAIPGGSAAMLDGGRRDKLLNDLVALVKDFALENPAYNSHRGLKNMVDNDKFKTLLVDTISEAMDIRVE